MTNLEETLVRILASIEESAAADNPQALAQLLRRREVICRALGAPEQAWHDPSDDVVTPIAAQDRADRPVMPLVA
jgi:hypothetical protein